MVMKFNTQKPPRFAETDPTFTKLLLHGNDLLDYSGNGHTVTANGDASAGNSGNPFGFGGLFNLIHILHNKSKMDVERY
jgi:hypothetical protein